MFLWVGMSNASPGKVAFLFGNCTQNACVHQNVCHFETWFVILYLHCFPTVFSEHSFVPFIFLFQVQKRWCLLKPNSSQVDPFCQKPEIQPFQFDSHCCWTDFSESQNFQSWNLLSFHFSLTLLHKKFVHMRRAQVMARESLPTPRLPWLLPFRSMATELRRWELLLSLPYLSK